jgi:hypothetical protein
MGAGLGVSKPRVVCSGELGGGWAFALPSGGAFPLAKNPPKKLSDRMLPPGALPSDEPCSVLPSTEPELPTPFANWPPFAAPPEKKDEKKDPPDVPVSSSDAPLSSARCVSARAVRSLGHRKGGAPTEMHRGIFGCGRVWGFWGSGRLFSPGGGGVAGAGGGAACLALISSSFLIILAPAKRDRRNEYNGTMAVGFGSQEAKLEEPEPWEKPLRSGSRILLETLMAASRQHDSS